MFNDGSRWIALLFGRIRDIIITSIGRYNINDIVCFSVPKFHDTYSGVLGEELDERVSPLSIQSQLKIRDFLHGIDVRLTMREVSNATKSLKQSLADNEIDINFVIERLKNEVTTGSAASRMYALRVLSGFVGLSFEQKQIDNDPPLFGNPQHINQQDNSPIDVPYQEVSNDLQ